jgi:hypothetical protein
VPSHSATDADIVPSIKANSSTAGRRFAGRPFVAEQTLTARAVNQRVQLGYELRSLSPAAGRQAT